MTCNPTPSLSQVPAPAVIATLTLALLQCFHSAWGDEPENFNRDGSSWGLGVGGGVENKPYKGVGNKGLFIPIIQYENKYISAFGPRIDFKAPSVGPVDFKLRASYEFSDGYKGSDSNFLRGMNTRKSGFWVGGVVLWHAGFADLTFEAAADASRISKGRQLKLGIERGFRFGDFELTPRLTVASLDKKYVNYYYGVTNAEALPTRNAYQGRSATNIEAALRIGYALAPKQSLFFEVSDTRLGKGITDSPLVSRSTQAAALVGYLYRF